MAKELEDALKAAAKIQNDPVVPLIRDLSEAMEKSIALVEQEQAAQRKVVEDQVVEVRKLVEQTRTEVAIGQKVHADRLNTLDRRSVAMGISGPRDIEGLALAAIAEDRRKDIDLMNWSIPTATRERKDLPILSTPAGATLASHWLHASFKIQRRQFRSKAEETALYESMERYEKAFKDMFPYEVATDIDTTTNMGGAWLPQPVAAELYRLMMDSSIIGGQCTHIPMTTKTLALPTEGSGAIAVSWGSENTNITDSMVSPATANLSLTAKRLNGWAAASIEEVQDSPVSILSWVQMKLTELAGRELDRIFLEGTVGTGPLVDGLRSATGVNDLGVTDTINGDKVTYAGLVTQVFKARERSSREGAKWFTSPEGMAKIIGLTDSQNMPVVQFGTVPNAIAASILGFPVEVHSVIKADRTYGTGGTMTAIYFGPPKQFVIGDRMGMSWDVSDIPNFQKAQVNMRLITRVGLGIAVPAAFSRKIAVSLI